MLHVQEGQKNKQIQLKRRYYVKSGLIAMTERKPALKLLLKLEAYLI